MRNLYKSKLTSPAEAVKVVKSNDRVVLGHCVGEPLLLVDALMDRKEELRNVEMVHMVPLGKSEYCSEEMDGHFRLNGIFMGGPTRKSLHDGFSDYTPCFFFEVPRLFEKDYLPVDVAMITVSTPDEHGYVSLGTSVDYTLMATKKAKIVIAEVNDRMIKTYGNSFIHISEIDHIIESSYDLPTLEPKPITDIERMIGENCAQLIEDGSTLQLGIGSIPDAVLLFLKDKKDLGIHSEMISDGVVDLYNAGVITNNAKSINRGKMIVTFLMGTQKLYDFAHNNPELEMHPVNYTNNPAVVCQNEKMISINSCVQIDLMGQINSETIGPKQFSGVGGQVDFVRGASMCPDGKSIIAIPSTAKGGKVSRIVPTLDEGSAVTTSRNDVNYVVTEYGVADLRGKTLAQRAEALINISHPDFREDLKKSISLSSQIS
ncbi:4-hydroxybutyrate CoA-transferase [Dethiosulfatibacter aminovorans DSM 17477]|uniref:4-hydroxybutyrate CoA-transferase n=1 Tax=Dethiosulfatibacter aminovorans DSM 17477 TaxID=1121476 RepID=A0A1M6JYD2_9FIRM|nr:acetyl-CoA hydrolase/transferase C-terminal domain-containing protein [Dethiosulfatibacter aminovorans]SHJ51727.1 4-hydroxybutyrate CoA-transferase [Dethiosulfatibacter aminovorans DSM 17477]